MLSPDKEHRFGNFDLISLSEVKYPVPAKIISFALELFTNRNKVSIVKHVFFILKTPVMFKFKKILSLLLISFILSSCSTNTIDGTKPNYNYNNNFKVISNGDDFIQYEYLNSKEIMISLEDNAISYCSLLNRTADKGKTTCQKHFCKVTYLCRQINRLNR